MVVSKGKKLKKKKNMFWPKLVNLSRLWDFELKDFFFLFWKAWHGGLHL